MRLTRVHVDANLQTGQRLTVEGAAGNHISRVLRLRTGDALTLFNGQGGEYGGSIEEIHRDTVVVSVLERREMERESPFQLTLAQGISRGERMDWVVQKATELGVWRIQPLFTERGLYEMLEHHTPGGTALLLSPGASLRIADIASAATDATVLIGPEGGLADVEQAAAIKSGFTPVRLGPRVLRTETAAVCALTLLQQKFGDL